MNDEIKQLLKDHADDLKNNNLDPIFRACNTAKNTRELRNLLLQQGIDPLKYVTKIPAWYYENEKLDNLDLSKYTNIKSIDKRAFFYSRIDTLILPSTVKSLEDESFFNANIKNLNLFKGIKEIPMNCFMGSKIPELRIPDSVLYISKFAFFDADIDNLYLPDSLEEVDNGAFKGYNYFKIFYKGKEYNCKNILEELENNGVIIWW